MVSKTAFIWRMMEHNVCRFTCATRLCMCRPDTCSWCITYKLASFPARTIINIQENLPQTEASNARATTCSTIWLEEENINTDGPMARCNWKRALALLQMLIKHTAIEFIVYLGDYRSTEQLRTMELGRTRFCFILSFAYSSNSRCARKFLG